MCMAQAFLAIKWASVMSSFCCTLRLRRPDLVQHNLATGKYLDLLKKPRKNETCSLKGPKKKAKNRKSPIEQSQECFETTVSLDFFSDYSQRRFLHHFSLCKNRPEDLLGNLFKAYKQQPTETPEMVESG